LSGSFPYFIQMKLEGGFELICNKQQFLNMCEETEWDAHSAACKLKTIFKVISDLSIEM
jgi:hypothetical protein